MDLKFKSISSATVLNSNSGQKNQKTKGEGSTIVLIIFYLMLEDLYLTGDKKKTLSHTNSLGDFVSFLCVWQ